MQLPKVAYLILAKCILNVERNPRMHCDKLSEIKNASKMVARKVAIPK